MPRQSLCSCAVYRMLDSFFSPVTGCLAAWNPLDVEWTSPVLKRGLVIRGARKCPHTGPRLIRQGMRLFAGVQPEPTFPSHVRGCDGLRIRLAQRDSNRQTDLALFRNENGHLVAGRDCSLTEPEHHRPDTHRRPVRWCGHGSAISRAARNEPGRRLHIRSRFQIDQRRSVGQISMRRAIAGVIVACW